MQVEYGLPLFESTPIDVWRFEIVYETLWQMCHWFPGVLFANVSQPLDEEHWFPFHDFVCNDSFHLALLRDCDDAVKDSIATFKKERRKDI